MLIAKDSVTFLQSSSIFIINSWPRYINNNNQKEYEEKKIWAEVVMNCICCR